MGEILFSVIVPTFNREKYIIGTLISVIGQTYKNFEIIVVDDGSTDGTASVVQGISDPRIRYYSKPNQERGAARNFGVSKASGDYVTFLDSDDLLKPNHLAEAYRFIVNQPEAVVFHLGYDVVNIDGKLKTPWKPLPDPVNHKLVEGNFLSCLGVFIHKAVFNSYGFNTDRRLAGSEDYELWLRLAAIYPIRTVPVSTALLVDHNDRSVLRIEIRNFRNRMEVFGHSVKNDERVREFYGARLAVLWAFMSVYAALHLAMSGHKSESLSSLLSAVKYRPQVILSYRFWVATSKLLLN